MGLVENIQEGCPPMSFLVTEHIQRLFIGSDMVRWHTKLKRYCGDGEEIVVLGKYGEIGDKMDFTGTITLKENA